MKTATRRFIILDERKLLIKEKIKGKVKEHLADLVKRMEIVPNEKKNVETKDESTNK